MTPDHIDKSNITYDPNVNQSRLATNRNGESVFVPIYPEDRLKYFKQLPSRWPEIMMARERGDSIDEIARWARLPRKRDCAADDTENLEDWIAAIYTDLETQLHDLADKRAKAFY